VKKPTIKRDMRKILLVLTLSFMAMGGAAVLLSLHMGRTIEQKSNTAINAYLGLESLQLSAMRLGLLVGESYASNNLDDARLASEALAPLSQIYREAAEKLKSIQLGEVGQASVTVDVASGEPQSLLGAVCFEKIQEIAPILLQNAGHVLDLRVKQLQVGVELREARKTLSKSYRSLQQLPRAMPKIYADAFHRSMITVLSNDTAKDLAFVGRSVWRDVAENLPKKLQGQALQEFLAIEKDYKHSWELAVAYYAAGEDFIVFNNSLKELQAYLSALLQLNQQTLQAGQSEVLTAVEQLKISMFALPLICMLGVTFLFHRLTMSIVRNLSQATEAVQGSMYAIADTSQVMTNLSKSLTESSLRQSEAVTETMTAATEINAMAHKNRDSANAAQVSVVRSQEAITNGMQNMEKLRHSSEQITASMSQVKLLFEDTVKQFENVIVIIEGIQVKSQVINDIVFQTKLLSFNASVEAARAGEHGKGFSVVAEEVGNLAQSSGQANREISTMLRTSIDDVRRIASSTRQMLHDTISHSTDKVESGVEFVNEACAVMRDIMVNADDFKKAMESISSASREQASGLDEISEAIHMFHELTLSNSDQASRATEVTETLDRGVQSCQDSIALVRDYLALNDRKPRETQEPESASQQDAADDPDAMIDDAA